MRTDVLVLRMVPTGKIICILVRGPAISAERKDEAVFSRSGKKQIGLFGFTVPGYSSSLLKMISTIVLRG